VNCTRTGRKLLPFATSALLAVNPAVAQQALPAAPVSRVRPTIRADLILDRDPAAHFAAGIALPAAFNVRVGLDAGAGAVHRASGWVASGRLELLARVLTDPYRRSRWALNAGGGIGQRFEAGAAARTVAIVTVGVEGPSDGYWVPGVELGLGGGVRLGATLRRAPRTQR
jgi:hypothetical protein